MDARSRADALAGARAGPGRQPATFDERESFFHLTATAVSDQACQGTACFVARHRDPARWAAAAASSPPVRCLGRCYAAPAAAGDHDTRPVIEAATSTPVVLERAARGQPPDLASYLASGGYQALDRARATAPAAVIDAVVESQLRGRGGAAFPVGRKWQTVRAAAGERKAVIANADEGDPGAYIDRILLEDDPHAVLEGMAIAAAAVGADRGYAYVRREYPEARVAVARAVDEARGAGILGPGFDVEIVDGLGSYVCGEETALIEAIEGRRPRVRPRPPYPAEQGLHGQPTLVQNVETLVALPWILRNGPEAYAAMGRGTSRGTKAVSLSSLFARPGLYEVELGVPVSTIVHELGGGLADGELAGVLIGGPLAGVVPPWLLDTPFTIDDLRAIGADVGHGGIVAFDQRTSAAELLQHIFAFGADESCGTCTPCRVGVRRVERLLAAGLDGRPQPGAAAELDALVAALGSTSLCGHGTGLAAAARSIVAHYGSDVTRCLG